MKRLTPAIKQVVKSKVHGLKWTFSDPNQAEMVALAELGQSNLVIREDCKLSNYEINYGLARSQKIRGLKGGYRRAWANGESEICKQIKKDFLAVLRQEIQASLPKLIRVPDKPKVATG